MKKSNSATRSTLTISKKSPLAGSGKVAAMSGPTSKRSADNTTKRIAVSKRGK
jgi:hypothetical protein